jgi:hypothetical protein
MRSGLFALAALVAVPGQAAITYQFTGTCTQSYFEVSINDDYERVDAPCTDVPLNIILPDYTPGTEFSFRGGEFSSSFTVGLDSPEEASIFGWLPEVFGPGEVFMRGFVGFFAAELDGTWRLGYETGPGGYTARGVEGTFALLPLQGDIPLPGTAALIGLGLIAARRRLFAGS